MAIGERAVANRLRHVAATIDRFGIASAICEFIAEIKPEDAVAIATVFRDNEAFIIAELRRRADDLDPPRAT
jgi:hypothetical protein